jgi:ankyrin repeat protein
MEQLHLSQPAQQSQPQPQLQEQMTLHEAVEKLEVEAVAKCLAAGAAVNAGNASGSTALQIAVQGCAEEATDCSARLKIMQLLLEHGANPNMLDGLGQSLLHTAASYSRLGAMKLLLQHGASITVQDLLRKTPVSVAVTLGHTQAVRLMCEHAAASQDVLTTLQSAVQLAVQLAVQHCQWECCGVLLKAGGQRSGLEWVSKQVSGLDASTISSLGAAVVGGWVQETAALTEQQERLRADQQDLAASKAALQHLLLAASAACKQKQLQTQQQQQ